MALRGILLGFATATVLIGGTMCYAEHHLKRLLAFSTICHAGMMLAMLAVQGTTADAAFFTYVLGHAFTKAALFFCAGIVLHRLRSMSEQLLWQRRRVLKWTGVLWFLGGLGLAGVPPLVHGWVRPWRMARRSRSVCMGCRCCFFSARR